MIEGKRARETEDGIKMVGREKMEVYSGARWEQKSVALYCHQHHLTRHCSKVR